MKFMSEVREKLGLSPTEMSLKMKHSQVSCYLAFERAEDRASFKNLVRFWRLSKLSGQDFMQRMEQEVNDLEK